MARRRRSGPLTMLYPTDGERWTTNRCQRGLPPPPHQGPVEGIKARRYCTPTTGAGANPRTPSCHSGPLIPKTVGERIESIFFSRNSQQTGLRRPSTLLSCVCVCVYLYACAVRLSSETKQSRPSIPFHSVPPPQKSLLFVSYQSHQTDLSHPGTVLVVLIVAGPPLPPWSRAACLLAFGWLAWLLSPQGPWFCVKVPLPNEGRSAGARGGIE